MKKLSWIFLLCFMSFISMSSSNASACSNEEIVKLKKEATGIKVVYEEKEFKEETDDLIPGEGEEKAYYSYNYFTVSFANMTSNYYIKYTNNINNESKTITVSDLTNGIYSFDWENIDVITKINYIVYTSDNTSCPDEKVYEGYLVIPRFNPISQTMLCAKAKELDECQKYVTVEYNTETQYNTVEKYVKEKEKKNISLKWYQKSWNFIKEHKLIIIPGSVAVIGVATFVIIKRRKEVTQYE